MAKKQIDIDPVTLGEVIDMALSDHVTFTAIKDLFGLSENQVKTIMRAHLRPARYEAWRTRVQAFGDRRATYKHDPMKTTKPVKNRESDDSLPEDIQPEDARPEPPVRKSAPSKRSLASHR